LCRPLVAAAGGRLCPPDDVARAAEAAAPARPADAPAAPGRPAAGALGDGRPALDRSVHPGAAASPGRSSPHRPHPTTGNRVPRRQAEEVIRRVAHGKALPAEVVAQIVAKTDGVPLFVEE